MKLTTVCLLTGSVLFTGCTQNAGFLKQQTLSNSSALASADGSQSPKSAAVSEPGVYRAPGTSAPDVGSIPVATGPQGPQGPQGQQGPQGPRITHRTLEHTDGQHVQFFAVQPFDPLLIQRLMDLRQIFQRRQFFGRGHVVGLRVRGPKIHVPAGDAKTDGHQQRN